jgi:hypothetical protein
MRAAAAEAVLGQPGIEDSHAALRSDSEHPGGGTLTRRGEGGYARQIMALMAHVLGSLSFLWAGIGR